MSIELVLWNKVRGPGLVEYFIPFHFIELNFREVLLASTPQPHWVFLCIDEYKNSFMERSTRYNT